ncbi:hypothetical protein PIIN_11488 [Serendipita indica DSM 11827]|uniref:Uncharacterized protein n=1 Tax=Serendipita indica (strain DSM 11827) TaxID=1109443 RepID=G4U1R8_SERID|nr:hypothetical protein PIIN_11488 [Serendipita indica DSM 11827]
MTDCTGASKARCNQYSHFRDIEGIVHRSLLWYDS